ncbi:hypothetical protein [Janthinobacterium fluminis]|uniref:DUF1496 domain-containing protein n=1 Tax=Janthinobacterium fluminis TaxID=2987524 RepID=A0ABT5JYR4_9BURK|nr:hypothetical protein [Janthinobacterium fluminis]MDC8757869.1 hypothetical protein [Janthinobacterium fluminis]
MQKNSIIAALAGAALSLSAGAQSGPATPESPYAVEACRSGCFTLKERGASIYYGATSSSYRVCARGAFAAEITVDGNIVRLANRDCGDVNGKLITLSTGEVVVGRLPN